MSYSRWGGRGSGHWYTYWLAQNTESENRDSAVFVVCSVTCFSAKKLRDNMDECMSVAHEVDKEQSQEPGDIQELREYALEFLADIDHYFPE